MISKKTLHYRYLLIFFLFITPIYSIAQSYNNQPFNSKSTDTSIIGFATSVLFHKKPEGPLGNFIADAIKNEAEIYLRKRIDVVFISPTSIKGMIQKGNISTQTINEILPFEDSLSYMELDGASLLKVLDRIAMDGGAPIAGVKMFIKNMRSNDILIEEDLWASDKKYSIIMIERNAIGREGFSFLKSFPHKNLPNSLTSTVIKYIKKITSEGKPVNAYFGHRISYY